MELLQLKYFQKVARLEHISKAAEELHIAQPALSKTIARLEKDLGVQLFERKNRQIKLNAFGHTFLKQVDIALSALEEGERQIADQIEMEKGRVVIASTDHRCDAELVSSFLSVFPQSNLRIKQADNDNEILKLLREGEIDFLISSLPIDQNDIASHSFLTEEIFLAVPEDHRFVHRKSIHLKEAESESFIGFKPGDHFQEITNQFCEEAGFTPNIKCEVDGFAAVNSFVQKGIGVSFLTKEAKTNDSSIRLIPIEEPVCQRSFQLAWMENRYLSGIARNFRDFLMEYYSVKTDHFF